ncbi:AAA family ATPase [Phaeobacter inhibens]|uniref:AAA family ATPase n=1 Tax=Phaeobacter inhibens TaxID=221822 RepID=UPI0021A4FCC7|nr:AAA family ATPase [Phaeobacter inhibens]UWR89218.1 AAA family ATPase [Phaeobacter inhibens]
MYLKQLELCNTGPIGHAKIECCFNNNETPKPIVLVGANGSGKSMATAHVVNALIAAHGTVFENSDVEQGKVYKLRSSSYIRHGADYSTAKIILSNGFSVYEAQFTKLKKNYKEPFPDYAKWNEVQQDESNHYTSNFHNRRSEIERELNNTTHLFFPPNRFEDPAWLNEGNLRSKASYASLKSTSSHSNRPILNYAPMRDLQNWLLDLVYDSFTIETKTQILPQNAIKGAPPLPPYIQWREGAATNILNPIEEFLRILFDKNGQVTWIVGSRNNRQVGININNELITNNLFQLSTGQAVLLDLFLAIIRDFDLSHSQLSKLSDIKGLVVVDEIDLHLHTDLQHDLLPKLIQLFPGVQFILTTHSPLFLMGMKKIFTSDGFQLIELPSGQEIEVERFSEFESAYRHLQDSARFQSDMKKRVEMSQKPLLYLEGTTDFDYLTKAAEHLGKTEVIQSFELVDAEGYANMDKIWKAYSGHLGSSVHQKGLLLYDCDANKEANHSGKIFRRQIPNQEHKIPSGIENLFSNTTIRKAIDHKVDFIDITNAHQMKIRGKTINIPEVWSVNKAEKRNLCTWICKNGTADDFQNFSFVFDILEEVLNFNVTEQPD